MFTITVEYWWIFNHMTTVHVHVICILLDIRSYMYEHTITVGISDITTNLIASSWMLVPAWQQWIVTSTLLVDMVACS